MTHDQELKLRASAQQGREADDFLNSPVSRWAFRRIYDEAIAKFIKSDFHDDATRREAWQEIHAMNNHQLKLVELMDTAKMAEAQLEIAALQAEYQSEL